MASVGQLHQVLQGLLEEDVPIADMSTIVEALADGLRTTGELAGAAEHVRAALARTICERHREGDMLTVWVLDPELEALIAESVVEMPQGQSCLLDPDALRGMLRSLQVAVDGWLRRARADRPRLTAGAQARARWCAQFPGRSRALPRGDRAGLTVQARGTIALEMPVAA